MKKNPVIEPIIIMVFGAVIFIASFSIETTVHSIAIGPDFMPKLLGVLFVIVGASMLPRALRAQKEQVDVALCSFFEENRFLVR